MKKLMLFSSMVVVIGISSCSKQYTCTCTTSGTTGSAPISNKPIPSATHAKATSECDSWQASEQQLITNAGGTGYVTCSI